MRKQVFLVLLVLLMAFSLWGCSSANQGNGKSNTGTSNAEEKIKLTVSSTMSDDARLKLMEETIKIYNEKHPDVEIDYSAIGLGEYTKNLKLSFTSGEGEDVIYLDDTNQQTLQRNDYLMDLTPYVKERGWLDKQIPGAVDFNNLRTPDKYYSVPFLMAPVVMYYNKDIFQKLDLKPPATMEEFNNILEQTKAAGHVPLENAGLDNYQLLWMLFSVLYGQIDMEHVNQFYYQKGVTPEFEKAFVSSLQTVDQWVKSGYFREDMISIDGGALLPLFARGESAMIADGDWSLSSYKDMDFEVGVFAFPRTNMDLPNTIVNATDGAWALNADLSKEKKQAALDFIDIFMEPDVVKLWSEGGLTSSVKHDGSDFSLTPLKLELNEAISETSIGFFLDNAVPGILDVMTKETQRLILADTTPEECWQNIKKEYLKLVEQVKSN